MILPVAQVRFLLLQSAWYSARPEILKWHSFSTRSSWLKELAGRYSHPSLRHLFASWDPRTLLSFLYAHCVDLSKEHQDPWGHCWLAKSWPTTQISCPGSVWTYILAILIWFGYGSSSWRPLFWPASQTSPYPLNQLVKSLQSRLSVVWMCMLPSLACLFTTA